MSPVMAAWLAEVGIITVRDLTGPRRLPLPSELLATFVVFGGLGLVAESSTWRGAANTTAWGLVVATLLSAKVDFLRPVGEFLSGSGPSALPGLNVAAGAAPATGPPIAGVAAPRATPRLQGGPATRDF